MWVSGLWVGIAQGQGGSPELQLSMFHKFLPDIGGVRICAKLWRDFGKDDGISLKIMEQKKRRA
jgi:hypothetical protein